MKWGGNVKILTIVGTHRRKGTIERLCDSLLIGAKEKGHDIEVINLYDYEIKNCIGCWACVGNECFIEDDFSLVFSKVAYADIIVLGVPCYWGNVPGIVKTFMDRHTGHAVKKPKGADQFYNMPMKSKIPTAFKALRNLGPIEGIGGKKFILISAMTLPRPIARIKGDYGGLISAIKGYTKVSVKYSRVCTDTAIFDAYLCIEKYGEAYREYLNTAPRYFIFSP